MISSVEKAILVLRKWETSSSRRRMAVFSGPVSMTSHGRVESLADTSSVWCIGAEAGDEMRFDLAAATSIVYVDSAAVPEGYEPLADFIDESLSMAWEDGTRLSLSIEKRIGL